MRIALYQPDIAQNTGTILRLAACFGVPVDIIQPTGFDMSGRALRRSGLDYLDHVALTRHASWDEFYAQQQALNPAARLILVSTKAQTRHIDFQFHATDTLLFGRESAGVPDSVRDSIDAGVRIAMSKQLRSLNVAVSVAIIIGEALRQTDGFSA
ncbi:MAG: tRNA (cytidine(34)-2'-O)-methyltransferase [Alphaproteobacteria bacterium]|nr:tRNA (cytidine(34)-2'-O)-methyltransferase [Alphaproteobacteria bacterium]